MTSTSRSNIAARKTGSPWHNRQRNRPDDAKENIEIIGAVHSRGFIQFIRRPVVRDKNEGIERIKQIGQNERPNRILQMRQLAISM